MFISSSNDRLPALPYGKIWLLVAISTVTFFYSWNEFWNAKKVPSLPRDDAKLWSYHRRQVSRHDGQAVVLIGSSRMQTGLYLDKFAELTGTRPVQLAIAGQSPLPVLQDLAEDESFRGTVISDFAELLIYRGELWSNTTQVANEWIKVYRESKTSDDFEFRLRGYTRYLVADPTYGDNPPEALKNLVTGKAFKDKTVDDLRTNVRPVNFDRSLVFLEIGDFLTGDEEAELRAKARTSATNTMKFVIENEPPQPAEFLKIVYRIEESVQKIQSRGGRVIIVNFPTSGELKVLNEIAFPRKDFWDVLESRTSAQTIHYEDHPGLSKFVCPDYSHLDAKDTPEFTENLVRVIYANQQSGR